MPSNRINNNDEVMLFMELEPLVRMYFATDGVVLGASTKANIANKIRKTFADLDQLRGYEFDTDSAAIEFLEVCPKCNQLDARGFFVNCPHPFHNKEK
jgi:hypothetical protein